MASNKPGELRPLQDDNLLDGIPASQLAGYVQKCFGDSKLIRAPIDKIIIDSERAVNGKYDPTKLESIKKAGGSQIYIKLASTICQMAKAIFMDIIFQPGKRIWELQALPIPQIDYETKNALVEAAHIKMKFAGVPLHDDVIRNVLEDHILPIMQKVVEAHVKETTAAKVEEISNIIEDQLQEGGFYQALEEFIDYLTKYPAAFIKGPVFVKDRALNWIDDELGERTLTGNDKIMPIYQAIHPKDIFPAPDSVSIDDSWLVHRDSLLPGDLYNLIGVPGFNDEAIRAALTEYHMGHHEQAPADMAINLLEYRYNPEMVGSRKIDVLEFWGPVSGQMLLNEGMSPQDITDPVKSYDVIIYVIGGHVIKAMLNPDPLGRKAIAKSSYNEIPGRFWGEGIPQMIDDVATACNAVARSTVNNAAIASGPQVERNVDRLVLGASNVLIPWAVWDVTDAQMQGAPAIRFYQPEVIVNQLQAIFEHYKALAHEQSGVPSFNFGNAAPQDTTSTASGFSMLISQTAKAMKMRIANIDSHIIEPVLNRHYYFAIWYRYCEALIGSKIIAKGSSSLIAKEQQSIRRNEFMQTIQLPAFSALVPDKGKKYLIEETARSLELDIDKIFPKGSDTPPQATKTSANATSALRGSLPGAMSVNPSGDQSGGGDFALNNNPPQLQKRYQQEGVE
ncbi:MAG: hypothetical protein HQK97_04610 [Nitrospirae bacterium]|nr:hypothetical protein [Nitrospirota bacterium]